MEAALISFVGGDIGLPVGIAASLGIASLAHWPAVVSPSAVLGSLAFSALIGVFFGFYPARKAARLNPIEALRFERVPTRGVVNRRGPRGAWARCEAWRSSAAE